MFRHKDYKQSFSRNRVWDFKTLFLFICNMLNKRSQTEIDTFFFKKHNLPEEFRVSTASAFSQCRNKMKYTAFKEVFEDLVSHYYQDYTTKKYYGFRLIGIDGTVLTIPRTEETIEEFGENVLSSSRTWVKAQVSFATDVLNNICLDAVIGAYKESEQKQAQSHFSKLSNNNLYLFDRGYFNRRFLKEVADTNNQFCFRLAKNACSELIAFIKSKSRDEINSIKVGEEQIKVRLTKVKLESGEDEYLLTSLFNQSLFTPNKLKKLYHLRWGIEEQFKDMKYALCIENFIGKKVNSIKQEFYANILTYNLSMMICKPMIDKKSNISKTKKYEYKANKRSILAKMKQCFIRLFSRLEYLPQIIKEMVSNLAKEAVPIRKGRKAPRSETMKIKPKPNNRTNSVI